MPSAPSRVAFSACLTPTGAVPSTVQAHKVFAAANLNVTTADPSSPLLAEASLETHLPCARAT